LIAAAIQHIKKWDEWLNAVRPIFLFKCAYSRIPLGVNYRMDCEVGLEVGRLAAQLVLELPWKK
jgi:hypothetical protein